MVRNCICGYQILFPSLGTHKEHLIPILSKLENPKFEHSELENSEFENSEFENSVFENSEFENSEF